MLVLYSERMDMGIAGLVGAYLSIWGMLAWIACALFAGHIGDEKGAWGIWWFLMGLLFGPIGLLAAIGLPDKNLTKFMPSPKTHITCPDCAEFVRNDAKVCRHCGCKLIPEPNSDGK